MEVRLKISQVRLHGFSASSCTPSPRFPIRHRLVPLVLPRRQKFLQCKVSRPRFLADKFLHLGSSTRVSLIAADKQRTNAPTLVNLCTGESYSYPSCPCKFDQGLLTFPPNSGDCMLILYEVCSHLKRISYCRVGEPSVRWHSFHLPSMAWGAAVHEHRLYFSSFNGQVTVVDMGRHGNSLNLVQVIEPPCDLLVGNILTVFEEEFVMISHQGIVPNGWKAGVHRLGLRNGEGQGRWTEGLGVGRTVFHSDGGNMRGYVTSGRMKGVDDKCTYYHISIMCETEESRLESVGFILDIEGKGVWVHPSNFEQWGFKNLLV